MKKAVLLYSVILLLVAVGACLAQTTYDFPIQKGPAVAVGPNTAQDTVVVVLKGGATIPLPDFVASDNITNQAWLDANATDLASILNGSVGTLKAPSVDSLIDPDKRMYVYGTEFPIWVRVSLGVVHSSACESDCMKWTRRCDKICSTVYFLTHFEADVAVKPDFWTEKIQHMSWVDPAMPSDDDLGE
jgi:hypothetical protein